ncbi:amino acid ABC transporter permease [Paenibacillus apiarius]|uniref:Amino acid ABC transporter permease n=1 Tax=Paenibacillus apiarius TaxID=46240 RepID=A0ABT4DY36_9BACL|nr:amino acid ABC transporter permease [Paenibacillus apiarius]MCY9515966.1 amino acid ABC transporter permease [Paenibacillus apiarius]MCY9520876.1 amino acid ABC transporter permease [Paenibacillus apiarius]MCY9553581.1 amino acid ABC transporter permease [Paenibacillus apiarius]MCY9557896.1 amino acid ABC transporter permease [Paenibacillus apiarius]MCY9685751.1 amino acid ABC transporter permease [Paenibacillus apiarius]
MLDWFGMLWDFKWDYFSGAKITVLLSLFSVLAGFILGVIIVLLRMSGIKPLQWLTTAYIELVRGTPLLVQIFIIYFGLTEFGIEFSPFMAGVVAVSINSSAYLSEIFRAGIQAIDRGQAEAARSLGMSKAMTLRHIVLPQAFRNVLPAIGNEFVTIIKETSIVSFIGITDIMFQTEVIRSKTYTALGPLMGAAMIYFILTFTLSKAVATLERKLSSHD